uniref:Zeta-carotene desaturase n=1 Tax=Dunaliella salina TaxID=3046 RepID=A0A6H0XIH9_DUNSA|nr:carotene synthesis related protein [Dunaliella salina]|mmetsp:Transcript_18582/g.52218  ORF Transcript_18582/g.52218 Transcript_18582/m.52218 type:complete len:583 (-) Transcript_18582:588-2336(-)|eukprot:CAMPEP_0202351960 /NCGR_PEP_ID=MMETSP1126-20121109/8361_1 /ASSEMBLY_ACC=CAM_ASM_000457 /TAXON_ID=3047 /ORGANISM="Dunaliella tertiolecta, Strain CCMP1320" /LENGTH=582 /DNA_ID=CAMNT_0048944111 /DNA_START=1549 /DNA_END=3297 /DNA_ORIENTATION=+
MLGLQSKESQLCTTNVPARRGYAQCTSTRTRRRTRCTTQAIATPPAPPKTTPREWTTQDVSKVALKDVPLKSLYPDEPAPPKPGAPKMRVAIVGSGLAGLSTAVELLDQGHEVDIYDQRSWVGGKVASWQDKDGNHIEMGLHVFFGCYHNLFRLMAKCGVLENLLVKEHTHTFCNNDGDVRELDFRFEVGGQKIGAPFHGLKAFFTTPQLSVGDKAANALALGTSPIVRSLIDPEGGMSDVRNLDNISFWDWFKSHGGSEQSMKRMWDPIAYALGFLDCKDISARCMLTIFQFFATKTDASVLRMLNGSPAERLLKPITDYIEAKGGRIHLRQGCKEVLFEDGPDGKPVVTGMCMGRDGQVVKADAYVAALDVPGAKQLLPQAWRKYPQFDKIYKLNGVPVITVQLRYNGWVTEMQDPEKVKQLTQPQGINNLLYSPDAFFSCFADLALVSPVEYFHEGKGSLMQVVITPAAPYMPWTNEAIAEEADRQVRQLFPSARKLDMIWHSVVKIGQSLYQEAPGMDPYRPEQATPVPNFFLAGSYTKQDYIDSMEGATLSGRQCAGEIMKAVPLIQSLSKAPLPSM